MSRLNKQQEMEIRENFAEYLEKYGHLYPMAALEYIRISFLDRSFEMDKVPDIMHQVYSAIGAYEYVDNFYDKCIDEMQKSFDINGNLLDVGCGFYPAVAERIKRIQTSGSISAIDYDVLTTEFGNIRVFKDNFTATTDTSEYTLIYGIMPCEATIPIIQNACANDKDMFIQLCGCVHFSQMGFPGYVPLDMWYDYIEDLVCDLLPNGRKYELRTPSWGEYPILKTMKK